MLNKHQTIGLALSLFTIVNTLFSQNFECGATDSLKQKFTPNAQHLTMIMLEENNSIYLDKIDFTSHHFDTVLNGLTAVFNFNHPARDTVFDFFSIHEYTIDYNKINMVVDSHTFWFNNFKNGIFPTGNNMIDSIYITYQLNVDSFEHNIQNYYTFYLETPLTLNMKGLSLALEAIDGVSNVYVENFLYDVPKIFFKRVATHLEYSFRYGWGNDCILGCSDQRLWHFKVNYDCSVEFIGATGNIYTHVSEVKPSKNLNLYPNPTRDKINIVLPKKNSGVFKLLNNNGQIIDVQYFTEIDFYEYNLGQLAKGVYFLQTETEIYSFFNKLVVK